MIRILTIDSGLPALLTRLRAAAEPYAAGYSQLSWLGVTPTEHLDQVAAVRGAMADAPRNDGKEPNAWTADRVRQSEQIIIEHRLMIHSVAAHHDATGDLATLTQVCTEPDTPELAFQHVTAVRRSTGYTASGCWLRSPSSTCWLRTSPPSGTFRPAKPEGTRA